jgi:alpha-tubulin suppressor-like RCC1 family protein
MCVQQQLGESVVSLAGGGFHSAAVTASGRVFAWGFNRSVASYYCTVKLVAMFDTSPMLNDAL